MRIFRNMAPNFARLVLPVVVLLLAPLSAGWAQGEKAVLPSWNDTQTKQVILEFVSRITQPGGMDFVPPSERIAVFDNDGTLWAEQPIYFQAAFVFDRARALAADNPTLQERQPYKALVENDRTAMARFGEDEIKELLAATHAGMTTDEFEDVARTWLQSARHPQFNRLYRESVYQPQIELMSYLRAKDFKVYIVSGGGIDFMRAFAEETYGVPPEQVIGSSGKTRFEFRDGKAVLVKLPEVGSIDDREGKPININLHIGRRPILAFGNSDGDLAMLQWTATGKRPSLMLILHHDDAEREVAYDRQSRVGRLDKALDEAVKQAWTIVSMKRDWRTVFPPVQ